MELIKERYLFCCVIFNSKTLQIRISRSYLNDINMYKSYWNELNRVTKI